VHRLILVVAASLPATALAHAPSESSELSFDILLASLLAASALLYARGVAKLWRQAGMGRGVRRADAVRFAAGWLLLVLALAPPLDALAVRSFAIHMTQHEVLMVAAAPLLTLSRPLEAWSWAVSGATLSALSRVVHATALRRTWLAITTPVGAWCTHAAALWLWHVPALFVAATGNVGLHALQHTCFLASALAFWCSIFRGSSHVRAPVAVASLFTTMLHTSLLGALLTFAPSTWYAHGAHEAVMGLTPLEDQQLGGLVMWVPGGTAYVIAALVVVAGWLAPPRRPSAIGNIYTS
jgi:putative membrane protein